MDVHFSYSQHPTEETMRAVGSLYEVYGIRRVRFSETERTVVVEYDATRMTAAVVGQLLRRAGLAVTERSANSAPPEPIGSVCAVA